MWLIAIAVAITVAVDVVLVEGEEGDRERGKWARG